MRKVTSTNYENLKKLEETCGLHYAMEILKGRWKINVLWSLHDGLNRYGQIKKDIEIISEKMLTQRLRELEKDELVIRKDFKTIPPHVEYYLTDIGKELIPVLTLLCKWGSKIQSSASMDNVKKEPVENEV